MRADQIRGAVPKQIAPGEFGNTSGIVRRSPRNMSPRARMRRAGAGASETRGAENVPGPAREGPTTRRPPTAFPSRLTAHQWGGPRPACQKALDGFWPPLPGSPEQAGEAPDRDDV